MPTMIPKIIIPLKTGASNSMRNTIAAGFVLQLIKTPSNQYIFYQIHKSGLGGVEVTHSIRLFALW
jgi:hypothetical protein